MKSIWFIWWITVSTLDLRSDLLNYLIQSQFKAGDRIPTISQLAESEHLGISPSKIREQLEVARALGFIDVKSKTGMRFNEYEFGSAIRLSVFFALAQEPELYFEYFTDLRVQLEIGSWFAMCESLGSQEFVALHEIIQAARQKLQDERWVQIPHREHGQFHRMLFSKIDNPFINGILNVYWEAYEAIEPRRYASFAYHQKVWDYHEGIANELEGGDFMKAQATYMEHAQLLRINPTEPIDSMD